MNIKSKNKNLLGFTLIEILVSLAICSILLVGLYISFLKIIDFIDDLKTYNTLINMDNMLTILIDRDISSIFFDKNHIKSFPFLGNSELYDNINIDNNKNILSFYTTYSLVNKKDIYSINKVYYSLKKDINKDYYYLIRTEIPFENIKILKKKPLSIKVADYIKTINFSFIDKEGISHDSWNSNDMKCPPIAISVEISFFLKNKMHKLTHLFVLQLDERS